MRMGQRGGMLLLCVSVLASVFQAALGASNNTSFRLTSEPVTTDGFCDTTTQYSGYFKIAGSKSKNYFYWFFESRSSPKTDPVILWLTGGPGCSSMLALLTENGPCTVRPDLSLEPNPFSWNARANVLWVDQPIGVGFSYGDQREYDSNETEVGDDMWHFLQAFFAAHLEYAKLPFHVFGESYAGHYVPAVAHRVFEANNHKEGNAINLQGIGIGNGLTDPQAQYPWYPEMAYNNTYNVKAVSHPVYVAMKAAVKPCVAMIKKCQTNKAACLGAQYFCNAALVAPYTMSGLNVYDVREECKVPPMCYDFSNVGKFLRLESTREKLHVDKHSAPWQECNMMVHARFTFDWMKNFHGYVIPMLEHGIRVLVYAGDADFIVNWMGCKAWTLALEWNKHAEFLAAPDKDWVVEGKTAGKVRSVDAFTFLQVFAAGHMVPMNQPKAALSMVNTFVHGDGTQNAWSKQEIESAPMQEEKEEQAATQMMDRTIEELVAVM